MKKTCGVLLGMFFAATFATASMAAETEPVRQTATAVAELDGEQALVTVDITGGWSVEFSTGAVYLSDGENDGMKEAVAYGYLIDQAEYDENVEEYKDMRVSQSSKTALLSVKMRAAATNICLRSVMDCITWLLPPALPQLPG